MSYKPPAWARLGSGASHRQYHSRPARAIPGPAKATGHPLALPPSRIRPPSYTPTRCFSSSSRLAAVTDALSTLAQQMRDIVAQERKVVSAEHAASEKGLRMLVFGKPGSGKGTLSARLVKLYDIAFVSTGDVLRKEIAAKSDVGLRAEEIVRTGGLVPDELMLEIVKTELDRLRGKSWIIDGFPRTLHQGKLLDDVLNDEGRPLNMIVHLNVPDSVIMARIAARWVHLPSGRVYNTTYSAPKVEGIDDVTGEPLIKRPDDTPEVFEKRLKAYYDSTAPLLEYFASAWPDSLHSLSGSTSDEVLFASGLYSAPPPPPVYASERDREVSTDRDRRGAGDTGGHHSSRPSPLGNGTASDAASSTSTSASSHSHTLLSTTPSSPASKTAAATNASHALSLDQLWPQLVELVEPFGLTKRDSLHEMKPDEEAHVREEADDLRDPDERKR